MGFPDFIEYGDVLSSPKPVDGGKTKSHDRVLPISPFLWTGTIRVRKRILVIDSGSAFLLQGTGPTLPLSSTCFSQLNEKGRAAIICSQGVFNLS